jgi:hypothetical protein
VAFLRRRRFGSAERGSSLIALLIVMLILGLMAAVTLGGLGYTPNSAITGIPSTMPGGGAIVAPTATTIAPNRRSRDTSEVAIAACRSGYATVKAAVLKYKKLNGSLPPAGTAWARSAGGGGPLLRVWPRDDDRFTIVWNGSTLSVVPLKGVTARGSMGTNSPPTGCFAT